MGVYIPNIEIPRSCSKCRDSGLKFAIDELGLKCPERKEIWGPTEADRKGIRRADCPLIETKYHGRLGDLDTLTEKLKKHRDYHLDDSKSGPFISEGISQCIDIVNGPDTPVLIQAEK